MNITNPTELRTSLQEVFEASPLTIGGQIVPQEVIDEAIEEVVWATVGAYMDKRQLTACENIVGRFFMSLLEKQG